MSPAETSITADQTGPGIAALVQVVDDGDESVVRSRSGGSGLFAVDERVGGVAGPFERDDALAVVHPKIGQGAVDRVRIPQLLDDLELGDLRLAVAGGLGRRRSCACSQAGSDFALGLVAALSAPLKNQSG